ncbi:Cerato-platanin [Boletus reticuloceps]|uniref:Cerato-platanin n=1 Tax=Boletus reticuloceps TaxID=495285 RepID=A0A8I2YYD2_9AGAM|nr:Cerato-platanin [Boletus reticuloceps]
MKFISSLAILFAAVLPCLAQSGSVRVTYDNTYDNPKWPLSGTACSNGVNGLETKYPTLGNIPNFPFVGGIPGLTWNSTLCGTCWQLTYVAPGGAKTSVKIFAVDESFTYNIAEEAFTALAGSAGVAAGSVKATAVKVSC